MEKIVMGLGSAIMVAIIGAVLLAALTILTIPGTLLWAYVLSQIWGWFLVPAGLPALGFKTAIGVLLLAGLFLRHVATDASVKALKEEEDSKPVIRLIGQALASVLGALLFWAVAWGYHHFL